jgi:uncharacterized membrane protein YhaH (DUF805 family)
MNLFALIGSTSGRLSRRPFAIAILLVYGAAIASQALLAPEVMAQAGILAFTAAQVALIWFWYALHAKRLHDAGQSSGTAVGVLTLWALGLVLYVLVVAVLHQSAAAAENNSASGILVLLVFFYLVAMFQGTTDFGPLGLVLAIFSVAAFSPFLIAVAFSIWTASRPSAPANAAALAA